MPGTELYARYLEGANPFLRLSQGVQGAGLLLPWGTDLGECGLSKVKLGQ